MALALGENPGREGQLGGLAVRAQRQIHGANYGDTTTPPRTRNRKLNSGTRWRSMDLILVGGGVVEATEHVPHTNVETSLFLPRNRCSSRRPGHANAPYAQAICAALVALPR